MINLVVIWNVNPQIFNLFGISVRWYSFLFATTFLVGYYLVQYYSKEAKLPQKTFDFWLLYMIIGAILGARLGHCFFYEFSYYVKHPLEIFQTWKGGLASHGGAIGLLIALWLFARNYKLSYLWVLDRIAGAVALGGFFIRLGNLMNSEIYGYPTNVPWAFIFKRTDADAVPRHPTQIYEALCYLLTFGLLHFLDQKFKHNPPKGILISVFLIGIFGTRFFIEFLKERQSDFENYMSIDMGQWLSIPFVITGIVYLLYIYKKNHGIIKEN
jgi:prolipoprotein diacylglyceryl transferase